MLVIILLETMISLLSGHNLLSLIHIQFTEFTVVRKRS